MTGRTPGATQTDSYARLCAAILAFVDQCAAPEMDRFRDNITNWGSTRCEVARAHLAAADFLEPALASATTETRALLKALVDERDAVLWEQSYKAADGLVGDDMLSRYGFVEVIGGRGPYISSAVRAGVGVFGPRVNYPTHRHPAEEIYLVLAGSGVFEIGAAPARTVNAGELVHVISDTPHGLHTEDTALVVFYLWQNGPLRQTSTFL